MGRKGARDACIIDELSVKIIDKESIGEGLNPSPTPDEHCLIFHRELLPKSVF